VEGVTIVKSAKDTGSLKLALGSFNEALKITPWWGDAYYNLAVAQELTGQLDEAERTLKWFMLSNPGESDARDAQDRIYAIGAKRKLAAAEAAAKQEKINSPEAQAAKQKQKDEELVRSLDGVRFDCPNRDWISGTTQLSEAWLVINGSQLTEWTKVIRADPDLARANPSSYGLGTVHPTSSPIVGALARGETYNLGRNYRITSDRIVIEHVGMAPVTCSRH